MGAWIACTFARADLATLPGEVARVGTQRGQ
jgi:hypothetical protein